MTYKMTQKCWIIAFLIYFAVLLTIIACAYLRLIPVEIRAIPYYDTLGYFILLGFTAFLADQALGRRLILLIPLGPLLVSFFSVSEELMQSLSPYRTFSLLDMGANLIGIWFFCWIGRKTIKYPVNITYSTREKLHGDN